MTALLPASRPPLAQEVPAPATPPPTAVEPAADQAEELEPVTPRSAMRGYLRAARAGDYTRAAEYLRLSPVPESKRAERGPQLAKHFKVVLDRTLWVDLGALSDAPEGRRDDDLPVNREKVGSIQTATGKVPVLLDRVRRNDGVNVWKISAATVASIPKLYEEFGYGALGDLLPPFAFEMHFLEIALWQWVGLSMLAVLAAGAAWIGANVVTGSVRSMLAHTRRAGSAERVRALVGPTRLFVAAAVFYGGSFALALAIVVQRFVDGSCRILIIAAAAWFFLRAAELATQRIEARIRERGISSALALLPLGRRTVKICLVLFAAVAMFQSLGFNVTGLLAGLGVGGLAVALAAQKTLENLFGAVTLTADQPVRVGDFCRFGERLGTVEDIGLRSTRIRTLDRTVVSVPNAEFAGMQLENFARRDRIWFHPTIGLRYETTADQLRYVLVRIRELLLGHAKIEREPLRVRFIEFGAHSLDVEVYAYVLTADYDEFLAVREDLLLRMMEIIEEAGTGLAFPSQVSYHAEDPGVDVERRHAAEEKVRSWRQEGAASGPGAR